MKVLDKQTKRRKTLNPGAAIKVIFDWSQLMKLNGGTHSFINIKTEEQLMTFNDIVLFHRHNYIGIGGVETQYGYLSGGYGNCAVQLSIEKLKKEVCKHPVLYHVSLDNPTLKFFQVTKTKEEIARYDAEISSYKQI